MKNRDLVSYLKNYKKDFNVILHDVHPGSDRFLEITGIDHIENVHGDFELVIFSEKSLDTKNFKYKKFKEDFSDPLVLRATELRILSILRNIGLGKGEYPRGVSPSYFKILNIPDDVIHNSLMALRNSGEIICTGESKSRKCVIKELKEEAITNYNLQQGMRKT